MYDYVKITYTNEEGKPHTCRPDFVTPAGNLEAHERIHGAYIKKVEACDKNGVVKTIERKPNQFANGKITSENMIPQVNIQKEIHENTKKIIDLLTEKKEYNPYAGLSAKIPESEKNFSTDELLIKELHRRGKDARSIGMYLSIKKEDVEKVLSLAST